jgi:hypothetical protein
LDKLSVGYVRNDNYFFFLDRQKFKNLRVGISRIFLDFKFIRQKFFLFFSCSVLGRVKYVLGKEIHKCRLCFCIIFGVFFLGGGLAQYTVIMGRVFSWQHTANAPNNCFFLVHGLNVAFYKNRQGTGTPVAHRYVVLQMYRDLQ